MNNAYIIGTGMTRFGRHTTRSVESLAAEAILAALKDAKLEWRDVQQLYAAHVQQGVAAGQRVMKEIGPSGIPVLNVENCAAAGATAIREAANTVRAGACEVLAVVGFEKMEPGALLNVTPASDPNVPMGLTVVPMRYAVIGMEHMQRYGTTREQFAQISVKNHAHAVHNPYAHHARAVTLEQVLASRMICDPINVLQCSPVSDGAAAVVVCSESFLKRHGKGREARIIASALRSDIDLPAYNRHTTDLIRRTADAAYELAGLGPEDVDVVELHDCFSVAELVSYEALRLCPEGEGGRLVDDGSTCIGGRLPVNPSGGLLARGHPLGATGVAQLVELVTQLRGEAEQRQVNTPRVGLAYNAGIMSACVTIVGI
jgi:acetyl-CoA acetyltransferase